MRPHDLADPAWLTATLRRHHRRLGLAAPPARVDLVDARLRHPHRPDSSRCRGWAVVRVARADLLWLIADPDGGPGGTTLPGLPLRVRRFPDDPALPALPLLTDPGRAGDVLPAPLVRDHAVRSVRVVRWHPGRSATVRCVVSGPGGPSVLYAKLLRAEASSEAHAAQRRLSLHPRDGLVVAEPVEAGPAPGILWTREVAGRRLADVLRAGHPAEVDDGARRTGVGLARLHRGTPDLARRVRPADVRAEAAKKAAKLATAVAGHGPDVRRLLVSTDALESPRPTDPVVVHGDCHVDQMLLTSGGLGLLDLDDLAVGDVALDLAELGVDLRLRGLPATTTDRFLRGVGEAHRRAGGPAVDPAVLRGYAAAELLNRCYRRLRRPEPGWRDGLAADLALAPDVLAGVDLVGERSGS